MKTYTSVVTGHRITAQESREEDVKAWLKRVPEYWQDRLADMPEILARKLSCEDIMGIERIIENINQ